MSRVDRAEPTRKVRIPVASNRAPLVYRGLDTENFQQRWVKDKDDRIAMFLEAGYAFVPPTGSTVGESTVESTSHLENRVFKSSGGSKLYLMQLPIKFYNEDQKAKQKLVDELEDTMRRPGTGRAVGKEVDYGSVSLERSNRVSKVLNTKDD